MLNISAKLRKMPWKYYFCILKMRIGILRIYVAAIFVALLSGCGSSKHAPRIARPEGIEGPSVVATTTKGIDPKTAKALEREARTWLGVKYKYGADTKSGTDCSGFVKSVYLKVTDIKLPRSSADQQKFCRHIERRKLAPGDLVFFSSSRNGRVTHVGLYLGGDNFIHASTSRGVIVSNLSETYYANHYHSGGRVPSISEKTVEIFQVPDVDPLPVVIPPGWKNPVDDRDDIYRRRKDPEPVRNINRDDDGGDRDDIYRSRKSSKKSPQSVNPAPQSSPALPPPSEVVEIPLDSLTSVPASEPDIRNRVKKAF